MLSRKYLKTSRKHSYHWQDWGGGSQSETFERHEMFIESAENISKFLHIYMRVKYEK